MPTYRITISLRCGDKLEGERWHPWHDLEKVTWHFSELAKQKIGKAAIETIEIKMIKGDSPESLQYPDIQRPLKPEESRKDLYKHRARMALKDRHKNG